MLGQLFLIKLEDLSVQIKSNFSMFEHSFALARASQVHEEEAYVSARLKELFKFELIASQQLTERKAAKFDYGDIVRK